MTAKRYLINPIAVFVIISLWIGCSKNMDPATPEGAFNLLVDALQNNNKDQLYDLCSQETKDYFNKLFQTILDKKSLIEKYFPEEYHSAQLQAIGWDYAQKAKDGKELFMLLVSMEKIRTGTAVEVGLTHSSPDIQDNRALIKTDAGEEFTFIKESDGKWRTDMYLKNIKSSLEASGITKNLEIIDQNVENFRSWMDSNKNVKQPEGSFNRLREAMIKKDADTVYDLCTADTLELLKEAFKDLETLRALIIKTFPKQDLDTALIKYGVEDFQKIRNSKELFKAIMDFEGMKMGFDETSGLNLARCEIDPNTKTTAVCITESEQKFSFVQEADKVWRSASFKDILARSSIKNIKENIGIVTEIAKTLKIIKE